MATRCGVAWAMGLILAFAACGSAGQGGVDDGLGSDAATDVASESSPEGVGPEKDGLAPEVADAEPDPAPDAAPDTPPEAAADTAGDLPCPVAGAEFEPAHPGLNVLFAVTAFGMMGQSQNMALGMFLPTAREDFGITKPYEQPLDTCVVADGSGVVPGCATDADCFPEQKCLAEKDNPANKQCITPRDPLDVGPFTATGFTSGPRTFTYNAGQSGAYTSTADGSVPANDLVFDQVYVAEGAGDPAKGLGAFRAELYVPAQLAVLEPVPGPGQFGDEIAVDTSADLMLTWSTGADGGTLDISLASVSGAGITCHAVNDGSFTIPADLLQKVNLGAQSFFNMLTLTRETPGEVCGEGVTVGVAKFATVVMLSVKKVN